MLDTGYLYAKNNNRIFVNTCLGCRAGCSYCYLPAMKYNNNSKKLIVKHASEIIKNIEESPINFNKNTLVTIGCFSECWDSENKPQTIQLIKYFLQKGNQIQLSTKKEISIEEAKQFENLIKYLGQLTVFVSSATIRQWDKIENGTDAPDKRFNTFEISNQMNIPTVLYMKPVLEGITIKDIDLYRDVIRKYHIKDVVVGSIFSKEHSEETIHFSDKGLLFYNPNSDEVKIKKQLMQIGNVRVFSRSSHVMEFYKEKNKDIER